MKTRVVTTNLFMFFFLAALLVLGCGKKVEAPKITEWEHFHDPILNFGFTYPKGWHATIEADKIVISSSYGAAERFVDPTAKNRGEEGVQLTVYHEKTDSLADLDFTAKNYRDELINARFNVEPIEPTTLDNVTARKIPYSGYYDQKTKISSIRIYAIKDSMVYYANYSAFNDLFEPYKFVFDTLIASIRLPRPKVVVANVDPSLPSATFTEFSNNFLKISYPDNFETTFPAVKGETKFSLEIKGYRQDCTVRIDIFPAKGLTVDKVFEQNLPKFIRVSTKGEATISGEKSLFLNYSPAKDIASRAYFLVKNDQVYRVIINYYLPKKADFLPAFEKTVASLKII
ncbi:MAG: hypothetical protein ONB44_20725 [candidate division KSB1 bacterium]|nr:hypothetical protein [candidate division KSB1 bacterium]MDZ7304557.1 hypothetical protein [candidate division KSB1 bacterium]MDZ7313726.1 hypothetical protein [candidate division KSB1 bacterium]